MRIADVSPLWKFSWPDGEQVYVTQTTGDVVQHTTTGSRLGAYAGAIPHWLYFTPLRRNGARWSQIVIWSSGIGTISAILGIVVGVWMYSPRKRYRYQGSATRIPYRGQKRWHTVLGLIFVALGIVTDGCYALVAGTMGAWLKRSRTYLEVERYVSGVLFIGLGLTAALAGNQKK